MNDRTGQILEAVIEEFIVTGEPVSSGWLFDHYDFGIKPAMIRLELDGLEEGGYLEQPHHSAGRVPSDAGYEFFAKQKLGAASASRTGRPINDLPDFLSGFSEELGLLSVAADLARDAVYKAGLEALIARWDWENREQLRSVIHDFEAVDESLPRAAEKMGEGISVFIGKKSPVTKSEHLSVIGGNYLINGDMVSIIAIGPKRMDYEKTIKKFKNL